MLAPTLKQCAKMPADTLLLNVSNGVFLFGRKEVTMGHINALEILDLITLEGDIRWHLQNNYYPRVPDVMIPIAVKAVVLCRNDLFTETIEIPIEHRMGWLVSAYMIVEAYNLEPSVNELG